MGSALVQTDRLTSSSLSDVGRTRSENQDACGEFRNGIGERLLVVADGMGGHAGGATASRLCIEAIGRVFDSGQGTPDERLRRGFAEANRVVCAAAEADSNLRGMGTTAVALLFDPHGTVWLCWVGDSRAYRFRNGQLEQLSDDHSLVADWARMGRISAEEAQTHLRRNELSRAIGPEPCVEVDLRSDSIEPGDTYLLCSDGLCGYVSKAEISAIVGFEGPEDAVRQLVDKVNVEYHSPDNVTVQIVAVPGQITAAGEAGSGDTLGPAGDSRPNKMAAVGIAVLIVAVLLAAVSWYGFNARRAEQAALSRAQTERRADEQAQAQQARRESERAAEAAKVLQGKRRAERAAAAEAATAQLEAKAAREEAARQESARLAAVAREDAAAREAALAREIATAREALARQEAAAATAAREAQAREEAERERILAEQESLRQQALAAEQARPIAAASVAAGEVEAFVAQWTRALDESDYALYRELGFRESEGEFRSLYGDERAEIQIAVLEEKEWVGGFVALRVTETYGRPGGPGSEARTIERRLVLRPTPEGMRFAGDRD